MKGIFFLEFHVTIKQSNSSLGFQKRSKKLALRNKCSHEYKAFYKSREFCSMSGICKCHSRGKLGDIPVKRKQKQHPHLFFNSSIVVCNKIAIHARKDESH